jgi:hypothetical protein
MFHQGTRRPDILAHGGSANGMSAFRRSVLNVPVLIVGVALLITPGKLLAQRGGGGGGGAAAGGGRNSTPIICVHDCPALRDGLNAEDDLKNFRRTIAVQATAEQRAAFAKISQYSQTAADRLKDFRESLGKGPASSPLADRATILAEVIEKARASNQNFLASFSSAQKSGLQDIARKLGKADSDLDREMNTLHQIVQTPKPDGAPIAASAAALDQALSSFQNQQLALGRDMGILLSDSQELVLNLPKVTNSITVAGQSVSIPASGAVSRSSAENSPNLFSLKLTADLSDLQQNITGILRSALNRSPRCGDHIEIQQASLTPLAPASLVVAHIHYERWICPPGPSWQSPMEAVAGDGTLEVKLTTSLEPNTGLGLVSEITRVDADRLLRDLLRSGDLGVTLREQITASLLSAMQKGTDFKSTLPPAAQPSAILQKAQFQDAGADQLNLVLEGQLQFTEEQAEQFATQLKQRLSAQGASSP